jgi:hypothetical protein
MKTIKMIIAIWILTIILGCVFGKVSIAGEPGQNACAFLNIGSGARALAMGQAFTAISDDVSSMYWNPGGMGFLDHRQVQFSHSEWYQDLRHENLGLVIPRGSVTFGAGLAYLDYGQIQGYDNFGYATEELSIYSLLASVSMAVRLSDKIAVGLTGKYIEQSLDLAKGQAFAGDFGFLADFGVFRWGLAAANFGSAIKYLDETENLPLTIRSGLAIRPMGETALIALDINVPREGETSIHNGLELGMNDQLFLRAGLTYKTNAPPEMKAFGYNLGLGIAYGNGSFDYSVIPSGIANDVSHNFSIGLRW